MKTRSGMQFLGTLPGKKPPKLIVAGDAVYVLQADAPPHVITRDGCMRTVDPFAVPDISARHSRNSSEDLSHSSTGETGRAAADIPPARNRGS